MTHANIDDLCRVYAARILELEQLLRVAVAESSTALKELGECSGALEGANNQVAKLRNAAYCGGVYDNYDILIQREDWLAIMGELP